LTATAVVTVTVTPVNDSPVITGGPVFTVTMSEDSNPTPFDLTLLGSDVDGDGLTWSIGEIPEHGVATVNGGGSIKVVSYSPAVNYHGPDGFTVVVSDGHLTATAVVTVTVEPVNDGPVITGGPVFEVTMSEDGEPTPFDLTLQASDADGDALTWLVSGAPSHGVATAAGTGSSRVIGYTPTPGFTGNDAFTVAVTDGSLSDTATVTVTVTPVNHAPTAADDLALALRNETTTGNPIALPVLANDTDPDGDSLTVTAVGWASQGGAVEVEANRLWLNYTPTAVFTGTESFTYTVSDGHLTATATVTMTVLNGLAGWQPGFGGDEIAVPNAGLSRTITVTVELPAETGAEAPSDLALVYDDIELPGPAPSDLALAGLSFSLDVYLAGQQQVDYQFSQPLTITVEYDDQNLAGLDETALELRHWNGGEWDDGLATLERDTEGNRLVSSLPNPGSFGLFGPASEAGTTWSIFLPVIIR
jgi:hypothetical protein